MATLLRRYEYLREDAEVLSPNSENTHTHTYIYIYIHIYINI
jgi:hypothetical protein